MTRRESQVLICAGVPWLRPPDVEGGRPYPDTAIDLAKLIRERGLTVSFEDERDQRKYVEHKVADVFLPILQVTRDVLVGISGGLFTMLIADLLGADEARKSILHVEYRIADSDGSVEEFKAVGPGKEVLQALDSFEQRVQGPRVAGLPDPSDDDYAIDRGLEKLREGRRALQVVARNCELGRTTEGDHLSIRSAIKTLRSAMNWLEGSAHFESAHAALDDAGRIARKYFPEGCTLAYRDNSYFVECPVALAHNRIAVSWGYLVKSAECSICGSDPQDCTHITGRIYDGKRCIRKLNELDILEISLVGHPAHPDARIESMSIDTSELRASLGSDFTPGVPVTCDRCMTSCDGVVRPFEYRFPLPDSEVDDS